MTLDELFMWHRQEHERWHRQAEHNKANAHATLKATIKRGYEKKAKFHAEAAELLKTLRHEKSS
jgi:hypothetical protein